MPAHRDCPETIKNLFLEVGLLSCLDEFAK